ncbi:transposase [Salinispirillum sp. LH 10-3-1]|uniref:Transposase n=1 Tax=Salinispirillum sp. LH 10-3-1 TaxID=2952525 RepID=A0AB38YJV5_9GAMM
MKCNERHFGMKMHIGVDVTTGVIHSREITAANAHGLEPSDELLRGNEEYQSPAAYGRLGEFNDDEEKLVGVGVAAPKRL